MFFLGQVKIYDFFVDFSFNQESIAIITKMLMVFNKRMLVSTVCGLIVIMTWHLTCITLRFSD